MPLKTLVRIKKLKLDRAELNVRKHESSVQAANHAHTASVERHQQYTLWRHDEESRLFNQCKAQLLNRRRLEQWQQKVASLREKEAQLEQDIAQCAQAQAQAREQLLQSQKQLWEAQRQVEKFNQLNQRTLEQERLWAEFKEEQELDEFHRQEVTAE